MSPTPSTPAPAPRLIGIATALMFALAGGALWCLLALRAAGDLAGFAFVVAAMVVWALRRHGFGAHWSGIALAPFLVAIASAYALYLQAITRIAGMLGIPARDALTRMNLAFAWDIARVNLDPTTLWIIAAAIIAAALAMLPRAR
ncbi:hypothetical protein [Dokdonella sp.]|uniref:hypothetical protein n=1 Tax=Dokdonella sp. TaxID=2291710 RepID=UPI0025C6F638|nr:hypothetical protein [Dokdonella sp.]MBX3688248.1 hypothetical protein [Dokdonella sp.]